MANITNPWGAANKTPFGYGDVWSNWIKQAMGGPNAANAGAEYGLNGSDYSNQAQQQSVMNAWQGQMKNVLPTAYAPQLQNMAQQVQRDWYTRRTADPNAGTLADAFGAFNPQAYAATQKGSDFGISPIATNLYRWGV